MLPGGELDQLVRMFCPQCADERSFERPECLDGHGVDCPERACVECGAAILVAPLTQSGIDEDAWMAASPDLDRPGRRVVRPAVVDLGVPAQSAPPEPALPGAQTAQAQAAQPEPRRRVAGRNPRSLA